MSWKLLSLVYGFSLKDVHTRDTLSLVVSRSNNTQCSVTHDIAIKFFIFCCYIRRHVKPNKTIKKCGHVSRMRRQRKVTFKAAAKFVFDFNSPYTLCCCIICMYTLRWKPCLHLYKISGWRVGTSSSPFATTKIGFPKLIIIFILGLIFTICFGHVKEFLERLKTFF